MESTPAPTTIATLTDEQGKVWVSGRSLFAFINPQTKQSMTGFMKHRAKMIKLVEGQDFVMVPHWREHEKAPMLTEMSFTVEAAQSIAEYSRCAKAVTYLISLQQKEVQSSASTREPYTEWPSASTIELPLAQPTPVTPEPQPVAPAPVAPKTQIIQLLAQAQQALEEAENGVPTELEERLVVVEQGLADVWSIFRAFAKVITGHIPSRPTETPALAPADSLENYTLPTSTDEIEEDIELTPARIALRNSDIRSQIIGLVNDYVVLNPEVSYRQVWRKLYGLLKLEYGYDAWRHATPKDSSYLEAVERGNQLNNFFSVAVKALVDHPKATPSRLASTTSLTAGALSAEPAVS